MTLTRRAFLLVFVAIAGIVASNMVRPVEAQTASSLVQVGDRVTLWYDADVRIDCVLLEIRGSYVRCEQQKPGAFSREPAYVNWYNTASAVSIAIREK